jgi:hypothetical protein
MSLLLIAKKIWQYKFATLPVIGFVLIGAFYVVAVKEPVYEVSSTYILVNPPEPPTEDQIARNPKLAIGSDNPYTRYSDQSVMVQVLTSRLSSDAAKRQLVSRGADPNYEAEPSAEFGFTAPLVQVTGTGPSPASATRTAEVVGNALTRELERMQQARGVAPKYSIDAQQVVTPRGAKLKASGQLRSLVAVFALGVILLFIVVSVLDAVGALRGERGRSRIDDGIGDEIPEEDALESLTRLDLDRGEHALARESLDEMPSGADDWSSFDSDEGSARGGRLVDPRTDEEFDLEQWPVRPKR